MCCIPLLCVHVVVVLSSFPCLRHRARAVSSVAQWSALAQHWPGASMRSRGSHSRASDSPHLRAQQSQRERSTAQGREKAGRIPRSLRAPIIFAAICDAILCCRDPRFGVRFQIWCCERQLAPSPEMELDACGDRPPRASEGEALLRSAISATDEAGSGDWTATTLQRGRTGEH